MKLCLEDFRRITTGAVDVYEEDGQILFSRFTNEQMKLYQEVSKAFDRRFDERCRATAGIAMKFRTDGAALFLDAEILPCTSRAYFSFDVFVDGEKRDSINNFDGVQLPPNYTEVQLPLGIASKEIALGEGDKEVCIYFPWSAQPKLNELRLDGATYLHPVKAEKCLLAFGDSITQGYDALYSSNRYVARLCDKLGVDEINKGIGGEVFFPQLAETADDFTPDYITVAYGTNDFSTRSEEDFNVRCKQFFETLSRRYPTSKIFAITPIWRKDYQGERVFGAFEKVGQYIKKVCEPLENVTVIDGFDFVPKDERYFSDLRLHPNDSGFEYYAENLYKEIQKHM